MLYPFIFHPIFKERIWGGRDLDRLYQKQLPPNIPVGESWEIVDRPDDESLIANGPLAGKSIHWLMENHRAELLDSARSGGSDRFPLLIKILDAREKLSLQVHPPQNKIGELGGEPKTEMWFIAGTKPGADLYAGLKRGVTRAGFEKNLKQGNVAECFHRIPVKAGDALFLPSGRVHAIGAGNVVFEVQQNSDTTYRVFDWNRVEANGKPRELHVEQSLASIDFTDFEPSLIRRDTRTVGARTIRRLVYDPLFIVDHCEANASEEIKLPSGMKIIGVLNGKLNVNSNENVSLSPGQFCLIPASLQNVVLNAETKVEYLEISTG